MNEMSECQDAPPFSSSASENALDFPTLQRPCWYEGETLVRVPAKQGGVHEAYRFMVYLLQQWILARRRFQWRGKLVSQLALTVCSRELIVTLPKGSGHALIGAGVLGGRRAIAQAKRSSLFNPLTLFCLNAQACTMRADCLHQCLLFRSGHGRSLQRGSQ